jgi:hypothetical protein
VWPIQCSVPLGSAEYYTGGGRRFLEELSNFDQTTCDCFDIVEECGQCGRRDNSCETYGLPGKCHSVSLGDIDSCVCVPEPPQQCECGKRCYKQVTTATTGALTTAASSLAYAAGWCQEVASSDECRCVLDEEPPKCDCGDQCRMASGEPGHCLELAGTDRCRCARDEPCECGKECETLDGREGMCNADPTTEKCFCEPKCECGEECKTGEGEEGRCEYEVRYNADLDLSFRSEDCLCKARDKEPTTTSPTTTEEEDRCPCGKDCPLSDGTGWGVCGKVEIVDPTSGITYESSSCQCLKETPPPTTTTQADTDCECGECVFAPCAAIRGLTPSVRR